MTTPDDNADALNVIVLGTQTSPGVVKFSGLERAEAWDVQAAKGQTGATTTLQGKPIAKFTATFSLAGDGFEETSGAEDIRDDFDRWEDFQRLISSMTAGAKPFALPIYHPDLARLGITEVTNGGISGAVHDGRGGVTYTVTFLEYRPAKPKAAAKATAKPAQNYANTDEGRRSPPDPNAARKAELDRLVAIAKQP
jgi:hypothetical protein